MKCYVCSEGVDPDKGWSLFEVTTFGDSTGTGSPQRFIVCSECVGTWAVPYEEKAKAVCGTCKLYGDALVCEGCAMDQSRAHAKAVVESILTPTEMDNKLRELLHELTSKLESGAK